MQLLILKGAAFFFKLIWLLRPLEGVAGLIINRRDDRC